VSPPRPAPALAALVAVAGLVAAGIGLNACGGAHASRRGAPTYPERVAARARAASELRVFQVRHNPTPCACPPWEILLGGHWQRAQLINDADGDDDPVATMRAQAPDSSAPHWVVQGELDEDVSQCGRGAQVVLLRVTALGLPDAEPDAEPPGAPAGAPGAPSRTDVPQPEGANRP